MNEEKIKKVGRPKKEDALTAAEKQKKYREKKKTNEGQKIEISVIKELIQNTKKMYEEQYYKSTDDINRERNFGSATGVERVLMYVEQIEQKIKNEN